METSSSGDSRLLELPNGVLQEIVDFVGHISAEDLARLGATCKKLNSMCRDCQEIWKSHYFDKYGRCPEDGQINWKAKYCHRANHVILRYNKSTALLQEPKLTELLPLKMTMKEVLFFVEFENRCSNSCSGN